MDRYQISLNKKVEPEELCVKSETENLATFKKLTEKTIPIDLFSGKTSLVNLTEEEEKIVIENHAETCFIIANQLTGNRSPDIPLENAVKVSVQLMFLPVSNAKSIKEKIQAHKFSNFINRL